MRIHSLFCESFCFRLATAPTPNVQDAASVDNATGQGKLRQRHIARPKAELLGGRRVFVDLEVISQVTQKGKNTFPSDLSYAFRTCTGCADIGVRHRTWRFLVDVHLLRRLRFSINT